MSPLSVFFALPFLLAFLACGVALWLGVERYWQQLLVAYLVLEVGGLATAFLFMRYGNRIAGSLGLHVFAVGFVPHWHTTPSGILMPMLSASVIAAIVLGMHKLVVRLRDDQGGDSGPVTS